MKKLLAFSLLVAAVSAQAVSFNWDSNNIKVSFDGATTLAAAGKITATLLWLGTANAASVSNYTVENGIEAQSKATVSSGMANAKGKYTGEFVKVLGTTFNNNDNLVFSPGDYFTVLLSYEDADHVMWYNLSSTVYQLPTDAADNTQNLTAHFSHDFTMKDKGTALTAGGGWTAAAVPEPSTAALALAGLALLLKRRKA